MAKKQVVVQLRPAKSKSKKSKRVKEREKEEVSAVGKALRALGGIGGASAGTYLGFDPMVSTAAGSGLGAALSRWLGFGDYSVATNSLVQSAKAAGSIPSMHKTGQSIIVRHREYISEIRGAVNFTIRNQVYINPGLSTSFPWLAGLATQFSEYRIRGMVFHYIPSSGQAVSSTNAAIGTVMIQTSYRASEPLPLNKQELLNEYWSNEARASEEFCHPIECNPKENPFNVQYVRTGFLPTSENLLMYDLGRTTVAVSGQQVDNNVLGDLWVSYEIELKKPVLTNTNNLNISSYTGFSTTLVGSGNPLGQLGTWNQNFNGLPVPVTVTANTMTFGAGLTGSYTVTIVYAGCTAAALNNITLTNASFINQSQSNFKMSTYSTGSGPAIITFCFTVGDPALASSFTLSVGTAASATAVQLLLTEMNPNAIVG